MKKNVLLLEQDFYGLGHESTLNVSSLLDLVQETQYEGRDVLSVLEGLKPGQFNLIIVPNNLGHGVSVVERIPKELRDTVLVIANFNLGPVVIETYQEPGVTQFCLSSNIHEYLEKIGYIE